MNNSLFIFLLIIVLGMMLLVLRIVKKKNLSLKYGSLWLCLLALLFIPLFLPNFFISISSLLGFEKLINLLFLLGFFFLFYISFLLTTILSKQAEQIKKLTQEISLLKKEVEK